MNHAPEILFADSKQERSQRTLEDILEAAEQIVLEANPELFTSRTLAKKSGYSLGTLVRRLSSIENVFLWAAKKARDKKYQELSISLAQFDESVTVEYFARNVVDTVFSGIEKGNPAVMRFLENRFTKINGLPTDYFSYMDLFTEPFLESVAKNKTDTFRSMSKNEAALLLRQICLLVERPFMENNPIAGTKEHRNVAVDAINRLLGK
jgi:AcrR family transcriptional regulator